MMGLQIWQVFRRQMFWSGHQAPISWLRGNLASNSGKYYEIIDRLTSEGARF